MSKTKKVISVVLALALVMAMATVAMVSASAATTVYFENIEGWTEVCAYVWGGALGEEFGTWPGTPCTNVEGNIWTIDIPDDCTNVIFNNNDNGSQTNNLVNPGSTQIAKLGEGTELNEYGQPMTVYGWEPYGDVEVTTEAPATTTVAATTEAPATTTAAPVETTVAEPVETTAAPVETTVAEPVETTAAPVETTVAEPVETTAAPVETTVAEPVETTAAPVETTAAPVETTVAEPVETTAAPAETTAAPAEGNGIVVDGTEYTAKAGDEVVYKAALKTPAFIEDVQGFVTYDADKLTLTNCDTTNLGDAAIVNTEEAGVVYFNASVVKGLDFTGDISLIELTFTVVEENGAEIALTIEEMTEKDGDSYFTESQKVNDAVVVTETLAVPEEVTTAPTTVPVTTEATTAATTTEATTTEATTAAATTVAKTDATSKTDAPVADDVPPTGSSVAIYAVIAVLAMAAAAVVVLRKKVNG